MSKSNAADIREGSGQMGIFDERNTHTCANCRYGEMVCGNAASKAGRTAIDPGSGCSQWLMKR